MSRKPKSPPPTTPRDLTEELLAGAEAGHGVPQELLPADARSDIVVHTPVMTPVARMVFTDWNTNVQTAETFNELLNDIREDGFSGAIEVVPFQGTDGGESYLVVSGEWRCKAAKTLGIPEIPASRLTHQKFSEREFQQILSVRRNNLHGKHDKDKLRAMVAELATKHPDSEALRRMLAFTKADEWKRLVGDTRKALQKQGATPEMMEAFEEKAQKASSLADLSVIVSRLFELYKDTVPFGFMIFTYGRKQHLYIAGTKGTMAAITKIAKVCADRKMEVNTVLGPGLTAIAERLERTAPAGAEFPEPPQEGGVEDAPF